MFTFAKSPTFSEMNAKYTPYALEKAGLVGLDYIRPRPWTTDVSVDSMDNPPTTPDLS